MALHEYESKDKDRLFKVVQKSGFSLDKYREANMFRLFLKDAVSGGDPIPIFKAYYNGMFTLNVGLQTGDYSKGLMDTLNSLGPVGHSIIKSVGQTLGLGSGTFASPMKPFIQGTEPMSFEIKGILPLVEKGDGTDDFKKNIQTPVSDLLGVVLPWKSSKFDGATQKIEAELDKAINWVFDGANGTFWNCVQNAVTGLKSDFLGGIFVLNEPLQYRGSESKGSSEIIMRIGPWRLTGLLIDRVNVEYSPIMYTDGTGIYPAYATVTVSCKTKNPVTPDFLGIYNDMSSNLKSLVDQIGGKK